MLKSFPPNDPASATSAGAARIAAIGLGYWGPNLLRVLSDNLDVEVA